MRLTQFTTLEGMLLAAIFGLFCTIPIQCYHAARESDNRAAAEYHADCADRLEKIASHPAAWMAEFRSELRRLASWEHWQSRRLNQLPGFVERQQVEEALPAEAVRRFWLRFDSIATLNGYVPPALERGHRHERGAAIVDRFRLTMPLIAFLILLLFRLRPKFRRKLSDDTKTEPHLYTP